MIQFLNQSNTRRLPISGRRLKKWIQFCVHSNGYKTGELSYIISSDDQVLEVNRSYLNHDYYTDIITFDYTNDDLISGDVFISIDRVKDNAVMHKESVVDEYLRVCVHGVLHLMGYKDKNKKDAVIMRQKENEAINMFHVEQF